MIDQFYKIVTRNRLHFDFSEHDRTCAIFYIVIWWFSVMILDKIGSAEFTGKIIFPLDIIVREFWLLLDEIAVQNKDNLRIRVKNPPGNIHVWAWAGTGAPMTSPENRGAAVPACAQTLLRVKHQHPPHGWLLPKYWAVPCFMSMRQRTGNITLQHAKNE